MSDALTAGRELDALVAEKVMGWTVNRTETRHWHTVGPTGRERNILIGSACCAGQHYDADAFRPSTDIGSAWLVLDVMRAKGWAYCTVQSFVVPHAAGEPMAVEFWASFEPHHEAGLPATTVSSGHCITAPLALCRAALKACEHHSPETP